MVCCALAAFLIGQLVMGLDAVGERLGFTGARDRALRATNAAASWRLGDARVGAAEVARSRSMAGVRRLALGLGAAALAFGLSFGLSQTSSDPAVHAWHPSFWCSSALQAAGPPPTRP
jgi:hypothetical protein